MAIVEFIYPKSVGSDIVSGIDFRMEVKDGPYEMYLPDKLFEQQMIDICSTPPVIMVSVVGAMNAQMNEQTRRMNRDAIKLVQTVDEAFTNCGYRCFHCFGFQEFGKYKVTSEQATIRDGILVQRSNLFVVLDTTPDSSNAPIEALYRLRLGRSIIALFSEDNPRPEYKRWLTDQVELGSSTNPLAVFLTYRSLHDLGQGLREIADFKASLALIAQ